VEIASKKISPTVTNPCSIKTGLQIQACPDYFHRFQSCAGPHAGAQVRFCLSLQSHFKVRLVLAIRFKPFPFFDNAVMIQPAVTDHQLGLTAAFGIEVELPPDIDNQSGNMGGEDN